MRKKLLSYLKTTSLTLLGICCFSGVYAQSTIVSANFNGSAGVFSSTSNLSYASGNSNSSSRPASLPFFSEGTQAGSCTNQQTIISTSNINTSAYCNNKLSFRLAAWSLNSSNNGLDNGDAVIVEISNNGGSSYTDLLEVTGESNAFWHYSTGTGVASVPFSSTAGVTVFTPSSGGNRTTDGYSTVEITNLPSISNLRVRITLETSSSSERWTIDDFKLTGDATATTPTVSISTPSNTVCSGSSVTFSSTVSNGGTTPGYQWLLNGSNISGANSSTYTTTSLSNSNQISLRVTSSGVCAPTATSSATTMTVNPNVTPSVSITASQNNVCSGSNITFNATPTNGGSAPQYAWFINGTAVSGQTNNSFSTTSLNNNNAVVCSLTSNVSCRTTNTVASNSITAQINANVTPTVSVSVNTNNVCTGTSQNFTSSITNGGAAPAYQWTRNGSNISGASSATYTSTSLSNGDVIGLVLTSNATCRTSNTATASTITAQVKSRTTATASVSTSNSSICPGTSVTFNSSITNGGSNPTYSWSVNGVNVGNNSPTLVTDTFTTAKTISLLFTPSADACPNFANTNSNSLSVSILPIQTIVVASASSNQICRGSSVQLNASAATTARFDTAFIHGFESSQSNWNFINGSTGGSSSSRNGTSFTFRQSTYNYNGDDYRSNDNSRFVFANSENHSGATNVSIISPSFSTAGFTSANLDFFHYYNDNGSSVANVSISTNGTTWTSLQSYSSDVASRTNFSKATITIPAGFLNQSTVFVRFNYVTTTDERYWAIDNVLVAGSKNHQPSFHWEDQSNTNVGNQANISNFSPNQSATLTLTATNIYGCSSTQNVSIQVDQPTQSGSISGDQLVCRGINAGELQVQNKLGNVVKWQWSNSGNIWNDVSSNLDSLVFSNLTTQRQFRAEVKNGVCASAFTTNFPVNVKNKNWTGDFDNNWFDARNWCGGIPDSSEEVEIPNGKLRKPRLNGNLIIQNLIVDDTLSIENHTFTLKGNISGNGVLKTNSNTIMKVEGNGGKVTIPLSSANNSFNTITINRSNGIKFNKSVGIQNTLNLNNGSIELDNCDLLLETNAIIQGGNSNSFVSTLGNSKLKKNVNANQVFVFHVGRSTYNPCSIKSKDNDEISVQVLDDVQADCNQGNSISNGAVQRSWNISKASGNSQGIDLKLNWSNNEELSGFNRTSCYISVCSGTTWNKLSSGSRSPDTVNTQNSLTYLDYSGPLGTFGVGSGNGALPVTWVQVAAKKVNETTLVTWSTASEKGTDRFEIERSLNGKSFEKIGQVSAVGNSNTLQNYSFRDAQNIQSTTFYRIKSVDFDGTTEYSKTVVVQFNALEISTFPNPTTGKIFLQGVDKAEIEIVNTLGKVVSKFNFNGNSNSEIDLAQLPDGIYFISITQNQTTQQIRVVKSNP